MDDKKQVRIDRVDGEIARINNREATLYFYVLDTKGIASGCLEYIYKIAKFAYDGGYNVSMLYHSEVDDKGNETEEDKFVGVGEWMGEEYSSLKHENIASGVELYPSDIIFIPEIFLMEFSSDKNQGLKNVFSKKVAVFQNYFNAIHTMPISLQLASLGIVDALCNCEQTANAVSRIFNGVKCHIVSPCVDKRFGYDSTEEKKPIVNIYCKDPYETRAIINDFYKKYPSYQWVPIMPLSRLSMDETARQLRDNIATVWIDSRASFGYVALEAMKSGGVVIGKIPENELPWVDGDNGLNQCCIWVDSYKSVADNIASVVRAYVTDSIPERLIKASTETAAKYDEKFSKDMTLEFVSKMMAERVKDFENIKSVIKKNK